jgi:hypothetical protein
MFGELVAFGVGLLLTAALGIPLAARLAQAQVWRRSAPRDGVSSRPAFAGRALFEPVDFGPDLMKWPSEIPRLDTRVPEPAWPSAHWDDPHFGKAARAHAKTAPVDDGRSGRPNHKPHAERPARPARPAPENPEAQPPKQSAQKPAAPKSAPRKAKRAPPDAPPAPIDVAPPAPPAAGADGLPGPDQLEAMIGELGLAGTVQALMRQHGWDFKQAAGWLARSRKR